MEDINSTPTVPVEATGQAPERQPPEPSKVPSKHNDWNLNQKALEPPTSALVVPNSTNTTAPLIGNFGEEFMSQTTPAPIHQKALPSFLPASLEEEEDEDMPVINMSSDSEIEEDV
jgi:hypothetical protein